MLQKILYIFLTALLKLDRKGANIERLLTAGVGINAEGGEFLEIIKKMVFQGKPWDDHNREHLIIELGDLLWYVAQATQALGVSFEEVVERNVKKLRRGIQVDNLTSTIPKIVRKVTCEN